MSGTLHKRFIDKFYYFKRWIKGKKRVFTRNGLVICSVVWPFVWEYWGLFFFVLFTYWRTRISSWWKKRNVVYMCPRVCRASDVQSKWGVGGKMQRGEEGIGSQIQLWLWRSSPSSTRNCLFAALIYSLWMGCCGCFCIFFCDPLDRIISGA